jgi:hypothetical protein
MVYPEAWCALLFSKRLLLKYFAAGFAGIAATWLLSWVAAMPAWFRPPIGSKGAACPHCGSKDIRPSRHADRIDRMRRYLGIHAFRCRGCLRRFPSRVEHPNYKTADQHGSV